MKWQNCKNKKAPFETTMVLREAANGFKRMGNLFEDGEGNTRLYIQTNGSYESFEVTPESVHLYEYLDESPSIPLLGAEEIFNKYSHDWHLDRGSAIAAMNEHSAQYRDECDRLREELTRLGESYSKLLQSANNL